MSSITPDFSTYLTTSRPKTAPPKTLFHCTKRLNLKKILKHGLTPQKPQNIRNAVEGVYLSKHRFDWMHYVTDETTCAGALLEVDVTGLKLIKDRGIDSHEYKKHPAYIYQGTISVERIIKISVSTDKKPASFREYKH